MLKTFVFFVISICCVIFVVSGTNAKPSPPAGVVELFENFREIEEKYEEDDWQGTQEELFSFVEKFKKAMPYIKKDTSVSTIKDFKATYSNLKYSISARDFETTEDNFIRFQRLFFEILENYEFNVPPALSVIQIDLGEVEEAIEEGDVDDIVSEMKETVKYFEVLEKDLVAKGVTADSIEEFKKYIAKVLAAGEREDTEEVAEGLEHLQKLLASFAALYK